MKKELVIDEIKLVTVDASKIPFLLDAAGIRVIYNNINQDKEPSSANYTVLIRNQDGTETPWNLVQSIKFELDVDEDIPVVTIKYIDYPIKG